MARSMTGFGRGTKDMEGKSFSIEMKSVNHRYLDINIKLPRNLISLEERIRKVVSQNLNRGKVDIFITQNTYSTNDVIANFNQSLADSYVKCLQEIKERYNVRDDISVSLVARFPDVITLNQKEDDLEASWNAINSALNDAISNLLIMREKEGEKLRSDLEARCKYMKELVDDISRRAPLIVTSYKEKLEKRLAELLNDVKLDESRVAMEVAIFSDKTNVDEEIVRLYSHLNQMMDTLILKEPIGRKLDFIIQEMNRETNTIGSKANDLELVNVVLNMKNEIEKIREQVQNIE
ncbi:YicC/YloC family endoribonuclease [Candidatus Clostridium stratigraminis]|uniref:YicC/YloC family endoribonuclease n=1 Tax=Candidatus Clostridium stratigraminis TaxID=3381661 RepID=A0ABW8T4G2_9CLOT